MGINNTRHRIAMLAATAALTTSTTLMAQSFGTATDYQLPPAQDSLLSMSLADALWQRHSERAFAADSISVAELSTLLWAACGVNRPEDEKLTVPSAHNAQDVTVYVCNADGAYRYDAKGHSLHKVYDGDLRKSIAGQQDFVASAPIALVLVSNTAAFRSVNREIGALDTGFVSENICLACTALGLSTVPRAYSDREAISKAFGLKEAEIIFLNHPVGRPVKE